MPTWPSIIRAEREPMSWHDWLAYLRELSDDELDELCGTSFEREREAAREERERRIDAGEWMAD